jgi:hypothetical protein
VRQVPLGAGICAGSGIRVVGSGCSCWKQAGYKMGEALFGRERDIRIRYAMERIGIYKASFDPLFTV